MPKPPCVVVANFSELLERGKKFGTIYADPPWAYQNKSTRGSASSHYETMDIEELCSLDIPSITLDDSHLHLWTTNAFIFKAKRVMESWGFEYRSCLVWVKPQMGMGNYWRVSHEFLLLGIRGNAKRFAVHDKMSWVELRREKHSKKPSIIRNLVREVSPRPYLELFGRQRVPGWTVLGDEVLKNGV